MWVVRGGGLDICSEKFIPHCLFIAFCLSGSFAEEKAENTENAYGMEHLYLTRSTPAENQEAYFTCKSVMLSWPAPALLLTLPASFLILCIFFTDILYMFISSFLLDSPPPFPFFFFFLHQLFLINSKIIF